MRAPNATLLQPYPESVLESFAEPIGDANDRSDGQSNDGKPNVR